MKKFWWLVYRTYMRLTKPFRFLDGFIRNFIWEYAWYKYGGGSHAGGENSFVQIVKFSWKTAWREE